MDGINGTIFRAGEPTRKIVPFKGNCILHADPLCQFLDTLNPDSTRVVALPERIWVFGGQCEPVRSEPPLSLRDSFWRLSFDAISPKSWCAQLDRPENHEGWWRFSGYHDLLEFERDACYLSLAVLLFPESPGSHAELGALAVDPAILPRLHVIVPSRYLNDDKRQSFLFLGPITRVERSGKRCVIGNGSTRNLSGEDFETITDSIDAWLPSVRRSETFNPNNPTHRLLLIADLTDLLLVTKYAELIDLLLRFGVTLGKEEIEKAAKLLDFFELLKLDFRGEEPFLVRRVRSRAPWLHYSGSSRSPFDRSRFKTARLKFIESDPRRLSIFRRDQ